MEPRDLPNEVTEIVRLIEKFLKGEITVDETVILDRWKEESPENKSLFENLTTENRQHQLLRNFHRSEAILDNAHKEATGLIFGLTVSISAAHSLWRKFAVAAAAIVVAAVGIYFLYVQKEGKKPSAMAQHDKKNDVQPGKFKAMLTLADGSKVFLDSAVNGKLANQGNTQILNKDGELVYVQETGKPKEVLYNTLSTSKGEMYPVTLSDGSRVWLNSASSIHYPVTFTGKDRRVAITGEAYFEVAKDASKPFIVTVRGMEVRVLGTHFNVNAYNDDSQVRTTLLEGSVKITPSPGGQGAVLKPGEQAQVSEKGDIKVIQDSDLDKEIAWKNRLFIFKGDDIVSVMNRLSRWYNVDVVYKGAVPDLQFYGIINMDQPASSVLKLLQMKGGHFKIEDKKIIVTP